MALEDVDHEAHMDAEPLSDDTGHTHIVVSASSRLKRHATKPVTCLLNSEPRRSRCLIVPGLVVSKVCREQDLEPLSSEHDD
jgi:hypothetical protein